MFHVRRHLFHEFCLFILYSWYWRLYDIYCSILFVALLIRFSYEDKRLAQHWTITSDASIDQWHSRLKTVCAEGGHFKHMTEINMQCCDLETMVSRLECTRVHFVQVSVLVSRPEDPGTRCLGLQTACLVPKPVARLP